jgi:hypothetical protein
MPSTIGDQLSSFVHDFFGVSPAPPEEPPRALRLASLCMHICRRAPSVPQSYLQTLLRPGR